MCFLIMDVPLIEQPKVLVSIRKYKYWYVNNRDDSKSKKLESIQPAGFLTS